MVGRSPPNSDRFYVFCEKACHPVKDNSSGGRIERMLAKPSATRSSTHARVLCLHIPLSVFLVALRNGSNLNTHAAEDFLLGFFHLPSISWRAVIEAVQM